MKHIKEYIKDKYKNVFRRDGITPYYEHLHDVASRMIDEEDRMIAYLHDSIEDGIIPESEVREVFGDDICRRVLNLTHHKQFEYMEYIMSIHEENKHIKISDIISNLSDNPTKKQKYKYYQALLYLCGL